MLQMTQNGTTNGVESTKPRAYRHRSAVDYDTHNRTRSNDYSSLSLNSKKNYYE